MNTSSHISLETLADIVEDRASTETRTSAMAHLATCSVCDDSLRRLQFLILMMKSDRSADVPRDVLISAIKILSSETKPPLRSIIATLIFDSRNTGPAFGMRSLHKASRQLLYSAQQTDLDLRITIQNEECVVAGQVIRDDDGERGGGRVEISGPTGSAEASLNELCEFTLPAIPVGSYSLRVKMVDVEIEIPELELKD